MATNLFADVAATTLASGVVTTPSPGTSETWTLTSNALPMPQAVSGTSQFYATVGPITDTTPEVVLVTATLGSNQVTVLRGQSSAGTVKTHAAGDAFTHTVSAAFLNGLLQLVGGVIPASYLPLSYVAVAGSPVTQQNQSGNYTLTMSGVTSGQPILVANLATTNLGATPISDTFSTPYTWTKIDSIAGSSRAVDLWIGTGGAGTSGVITVVGSNPSAGAAIPLSGASTGAGLAAIDVATAGTWNNVVSPVTQIDTTSSGGNLAATAVGELFIVALSTDGIIATEPAAPWVNTILQIGSSNFCCVSTLSNPSPGWATPEPATAIASTPKGIVGTYTLSSAEWVGCQAVIKSLGN